MTYWQIGSIAPGQVLNIDIYIYAYVCLTYRYIVSPGIRRMSRTAAPHQPLTNQFAVPSVYLRNFSVTDWWHGNASRCKGNYIHSYINVWSLEFEFSIPIICHRSSPSTSHVAWSPEERRTNMNVYRFPVEPSDRSVDRTHYKSSRAWVLRIPPMTVGVPEFDLKCPGESHATDFKFA